MLVLKIPTAFTLPMADMHQADHQQTLQASHRVYLKLSNNHTIQTEVTNTRQLVQKKNLCALFLCIVIEPTKKGTKLNTPFYKK